MASLKEIKGRIASVQSTLKITSAMKMVSSAKLHKVQGTAASFAEYESRLSAMVATLRSVAKVSSPFTLSTTHRYVTSFFDPFPSSCSGTHTSVGGVSVTALPAAGEGKA